MLGVKPVDLLTWNQQRTAVYPLVRTKDLDPLDAVPPARLSVLLNPAPPHFLFDKSLLEAYSIGYIIFRLVLVAPASGWPFGFGSTSTSGCALPHPSAAPPRRIANAFNGEPSSLMALQDPNLHNFGAVPSHLESRLA